MKAHPPDAFAELLRNRYGNANGLPRIAVQAEMLFEGYYGVRSAGRGPRPALRVSSKSADDGETLCQPRRGHRQYVVTQSLSDDGVEEYVVTSRSFAQEPAVIDTHGEPVSTDTSPFHEYEVDILRPLAGAPPRPEPAAEVSSAPPSPPAAAAPIARTAPESPRHAAPPAEPTPAPATPPAHTAPPRVGAEGAGPGQGASEDDFMEDLKEILSGNKVYDQAQGKAVAKGPASGAPPGGRPPAPPQQLQQQNGQAIFDRIAQSMQYANAYDLGTVELENRFADFDRISDLQRQRDRKKAPAAGPGTAAPSNGAPRSRRDAATLPADFDSAEVSSDLDAMRSDHQQLERKAPEPSVAPPYSAPFYAAGEHAGVQAELHAGKLRVGKGQKVGLSYGEIIAMADLYEDDTKLMDADPAEVTKLKVLIDQSRDYYKSGKRTGTDPSDKDWSDATQQRYLKLAEQNYQHFAPEGLIRGGLELRASSRGNSKQAWESYHRKAIGEARKLATSGPPPFLERPLIINAFGDHFLTDAFAAGHLINKQALIERFQQRFYKAGKLEPAAEKFFDGVAARAFVGPVKTKFSRLEPVDPRARIFLKRIDSVGNFATFLKFAATEASDRVGNLVADILHGKLNREGVEVTHRAGHKPWLLTGDATLNSENLAIMTQAVQQSIDNVMDAALPANAGIPFENLFDKVWRHTPTPTVPSSQKLAKLVEDFTDPLNATFEQAAAAAITERADQIIAVAIAEKKLQ